ncbi:MAG: hypothetical protein NVSMB1_22700 [Polyangiales bacterium]
MNWLNIALVGGLVALGCSSSDSGNGVSAGDTGGPGSDSSDTATADETPTGSEAGKSDSDSKGETTTGDASGSDSKPSDSASEAAPVDCSSCAMSNCLSEVSTCFGVPACKKMLDCLQTCKTDACRSTCIKDNPTPEGDAFLKCMATKCSGCK